MAIISINNLRVDTIIGILEHEKHNSQPLFIDVDMQCNIANAALSDRIEDALNYADIAEQIQSITQQSNKKLLEGLISEITDSLLKEHSAIDSIEITIRKPNAIANADCAAVTLSRTRNPAQKS